MRRFLVFAVLILVVAAFTGAQPVEDLRDLVAAGDFEGLAERYGELSASEDFAEIEAGLLDIARERVVASDYDDALVILEVILNVNLFNIEAQDVYVAVTSIIKGRVPGSDAPAVAAQPEDTGTAVEATSSPVDTVPTMTSAPVTEPTEPVVASAPPAATPVEPASEAAETPAPSTPTPEAATPVEPASEAAEVEAADTTPPGTQVAAPDTVVAQTPAAETPPATVTDTAATEIPEAETSPGATAPEEADSVPQDLQPIVEPEVVTGPRVEGLSYEAYLGPVSFLGNASGFYRDFYGSGRFNVTYGLSLDATVLLYRPRIIVGADLSFDGHFANLGAGTGDQIAYKVSANVALPAHLPPSLFFRLGFTQQWYLFGTEVPDVLITSFPSPTLGVWLDDLLAQSPIDLDVSLDIYLISFFTSYFWLGLDAVAAATFTIPVTETLSINPRIGLQPQFVFASGNTELVTKLEIGFGVASYGP